MGGPWIQNWPHQKCPEPTAAAPHCSDCTAEFRAAWPRSGRQTVAQCRVGSRRHWTHVQPGRSSDGPGPWILVAHSAGPGHFWHEYLTNVLQSALDSHTSGSHRHRGNTHFYCAITSSLSQRLKHKITLVQGTFSGPSWKSLYPNATNAQQRQLRHYLFLRFTPLMCNVHVIALPQGSGPGPTVPGVLQNASNKVNNFPQGWCYNFVRPRKNSHHTPSQASLTTIHEWRWFRRLSLSMPTLLRNWTIFMKKQYSLIPFTFVHDSIMLWIPHTNSLNPKKYLKFLSSQGKRTPSISLYCTVFPSLAWGSPPGQADDMW